MYFESVGMHLGKRLLVQLTIDDFKLEILYTERTLNIIGTINGGKFHKFLLP